jgi:hypothetical protein
MESWPGEGLAGINTARLCRARETGGTDRPVARRRSFGAILRQATRDRPSRGRILTDKVNRRFPARSQGRPLAPPLGRGGAWWMPHSVLALPAQRPAREPAASPPDPPTWDVQGAQPIEG